MISYAQLRALGLLGPSGTTHDFGDGAGAVDAHQHANPDLTTGGWVADTAEVHYKTFIAATAVVYGNARVGSGVSLLGTSAVYDNAFVARSVLTNSTAREDAFIDGSALDNSTVRNNARIRNASIVNSQIYNQAEVQGSVVNDTIIQDGAKVLDNAIVDGSTLNDHAKVFGGALVVGSTLSEHIFVYDEAEVTGVVLPTETEVELYAGIQSTSPYSKISGNRSVPGDPDDTSNFGFIDGVPNDLDDVVE